MAQKEGFAGISFRLAGDGGKKSKYSPVFALAHAHALWHVRTAFESLPFMPKRAIPDGCSAFRQFYKRIIPFSHTKSKPSTAEYRSCKRGVERQCGFDFERRSDGVKERRRFFEKENAVANDT